MLDPFKEKYQEISPKKPQPSMGGNIDNKYKTSNETEGRRKNYLADESGQSSRSYRSTDGQRSDGSDTSSEESKESDSESRATESVTKDMMNTIDPKNSFTKIDVEVESGAVITARAELNTQVRRKERLEGESEELDKSISDLKDQINEIEKQKLKIKLERRDERKTEKKNTKNNKNKRSTETQYLRTDPHNDKAMKKVKDNVDISLKVQDTANQWLKKNERLLTPNTKKKTGDPSVESQNESSNDSERNRSSARTQKKYDTLMGSNVEGSKSKGRGRTDSSVESSLSSDISSSISSDNISSFSESAKNSTRRNLEKTSELYRDAKPQLSQSPKKGRKRKLKKKSGVRKPNKLNFYQGQDSASEVSAQPKAKKIRPKRKKKVNK